VVRSLVGLVESLSLTLEQGEERVYRTCQRVVWRLRNSTPVVLVQLIHLESIDTRLRVGENLVDIGERERGRILRARVDVVG